MQLNMLRKDHDNSKNRKNRGNSDNEVLLNELRKSETIHRQIFQQSALPQLICKQASLEIIKVNEAAIELYGYHEDEFLRLDIRQLRSPSVRAGLDERVKLAMQAEKPPKYIVPHLQKNGQQLIIEVSAAKMDYDGIPTFLISLNDYTHRAHLEREIEDLRLMMQKNIMRATLDGQEKQREEIARELHDNINQILGTVVLFISMLRTEDAAKAEIIAKAKESAKFCIDEIRRLSHSLTPPSLKDSLQESIERLIRLIPFVKGEYVDLEIVLRDESMLSEGLKVTIYRIIQEQLNNILKYASASFIQVRITQDHNHLSLLIEDNGQGFDVKAKRKGIGLANITNRAELYNGEAIIESSPGRGCRLLVNFKN